MILTPGSMLNDGSASSMEQRRLHFIKQPSIKQTDR